MRWLPKWRDLSLRAKCQLLISFPAAATVLLFGVANILAGRSGETGERIRRTLETGEAIQRLRAAGNESSTLMGAYFITAQETFAAAASSALAGFDSTQQKLVDLTSENPSQQQRLDQIASLERSRVGLIFSGEALFRSGGLPEYQARATLAATETERLRMEDLLEGMEQDNTRRLEQYLSLAHKFGTRQRAAIGFGLLFGVLGGVATTWLFAPGITNRIHLLERNVARLAIGDAPSPLAGRDEIGVLNKDLIRRAEALGRKAAALDHALYGIAELDASGRYLWINQAYAEMAGCSQVHLPADIAATVRPQDRPRVEEAIARMRVNGRAEIEACIDQPGGGAVELGITFLSAEGPAPGFYAFLREAWAGKEGDVTLLRAKEAAEASNRAKSEFLAKISHDIRTPLNAILGAADLLSETPLSSDQSAYVSMFQRNCRRLVALINDFLDFSRIEAGAIRVEKVPFHIGATVDDAVATFREAAVRQGITLGVEIDPSAPTWGMGDPLRIQQVLVNLVSNALKFTRSGRVDVKVKVVKAASSGEEQRPSHPKLRFEVRDTGPGIPLEDQDKIFARFVQLPNHGSSQHGAGLGLTICRDLVELMGGEIGVLSGDGGGSTFHFSLPLEVAEPVAGAPIANNTPASLLSDEISQIGSMQPESIRILVAEDTEDNRILVEHYLRAEPVKLLFALNGQEALDAVQRGEPFDLILMDIDMPVLDGYTATKRIRTWQEEHGTATPIIALSADAMRESVEASLEAGCVAHVAKPVDRDTLLKAIRRYVPAKGATNVPIIISPTPGPNAGSSAEPIRISDEVMALVPQYLATKDKQIKEARASLASGDFGPIRRFGHNLKGTGRGYGFPPIEEMGREIETAAGAADASRIADQLDALHKFVSEAAAVGVSPSVSR